MAFTLLKPSGIDLSQTFAFTGTVSGAGGGKLLQIQHTNYNTAVSTSDQGYVTTGLTCAITPSATN